MVLGAGASGLSAARLACREGASVCLADTGCGSRLLDTQRQLSAEGIRMETNWQPPAQHPECDLCIVSPGVPDSSAMVNYFQGLGCPVISELEFGSRYCNGMKLAITGTNGKTTVVEMLTHCLETLGKSVRSCGNIGLPLSQVALEKTNNDILVVEVSSFQMELTGHFPCQSAALLNITPDHLSRHGTMENYRDMKLRLLRQVVPDGTCIVRSDILRDSAAADALSGRKCLTFSSEADALADYVVHDNALCRRIDGNYIKLLPLSALSYDGMHNYENCLAVIAMGESIGIPAAELAPHLTTFHIGPHRMEIVGEHNNVRFVNDSKATNLDALVQSLRKFGNGSKDIALIAGGLTKGCNLEAALPAMNTCVKGAFLIGTSRDELATAWGRQIPCRRCDSLEDAFNQAVKCVEDGGTVLLSPGCASQDMFKDYIERGSRFVDLVNRLRNHNEQERK
ncbi:MAG: UDP-N-acetylmuramoyl-L-alanine--D-glutamate ligase [Victivallales bacterium]|nr:UDP-N-acetylmuramoyl-L-alanine--D-glutamate ligase [Victivallales bacterium]